MMNRNSIKEHDVGKLTVLTLVPNAGDRLRRCLESVSWADDLFCIVDPNTSDGSDAVAREYSRHVVVHPYENKAAQCNWALPQIETEWTLVLDADEWISEELGERIRAIIATPGGPNGYSIKRMTYFFGRLIRHCGWHRDYNIRLFRTKKARYQQRRVHASVEVEGALGRIDAVMYHEPYRTFDEYFATNNRFTTWNALDAFEKGKRAHFTDLTVRPVLRFFKMFVLRAGFLDGMHGVVVCGLAALSVFTKYAKLWNLERVQREERKSDAD